MLPMEYGDYLENWQTGLYDPVIDYWTKQVPLPQEFHRLPEDLSPKKLELLHRQQMTRINAMQFVARWRLANTTKGSRKD